MAIEVSSLIALLRGDDDDPPVPHPQLIALIIDGLVSPEGGRFMGSVFTLAERVFPECEELSPKTSATFSNQIGLEMWNALVTGHSLWRKQSAAVEDDAA